MANMTTKIQISNTVMKTLTEMVQTSVTEAVSVLSEKYGFDRAEALEIVKVAEMEVTKGKKAKAPKKEKVVVPKKPAFLLPWCGKSVGGWCGALRYNKGLYTQCTQKCKGGSQFCTTCLKHVSVDGIPQYGLVSERNNEGWTAPNGKTPVNYANVMDKLKNGDDVVTQEMAVAEAAKFDWTIPEEQFIKSKARKGRPAKAKAEKTEKKTRGRPKKEKPMTQGGAGDDLIAQLVAQAEVQNQQMGQPFTPPSPAAVQEHLDELQLAEGDKQVLQQDPLNHPEEESVEDESTDQSEPTTPTNQPTKAVKPDAPKKAKKARKPKMTEEEKEAAKLAKQQEREAKKAAAKAEKEAAKAKAKAEKEAAKAAAKAEKEAAKAKAKAEKEAAKKAPKKVDTPVESPETQTDEKEATPEQLADQLQQMELEPESPVDLEGGDESEEEEEEVKVETKTGADGKTYMVDADGNVYDEEGYEIGTWDEEAKAVIA